MYTLLCHSESLNSFTKQIIINGNSAVKLLNFVVTFFLEYIYETRYNNRHEGTTLIQTWKGLLLNTIVARAFQIG